MTSQSTGGATGTARGGALRSPEAVLIAITFLWGSSFIVTKGVLRDVAPLPYLVARYGLAALVLLVLYPRSLRAARRTWVDAAVLGVGQGGGLLLQVIGQVYTTASKAAFVTALSVALTPLLGLALYGDVPRRRQVFGILLASVGLLFLTYPAAGADWNRGDFYSAGCALVYAWVIVETSRRAPRSDTRELSTLLTLFIAVAFLGLLVGVRGLLWLAPADSLPTVIQLEARPVATLLLRWHQVVYMAIGCTVLTVLGQTWAQARMSATLAAVIYALEPLFATGLAILVEGSTEWPGARGGVGASLIVCGLLAAELDPARWLKRFRRTPADGRRRKRGDVDV